jgi:hypothetical protein
MQRHVNRLLTRQRPAALAAAQAPDRHRSALTIRDHVLPLVQVRGQRHQYGCTGGSGRFHLTTWESDPLRFVLRVPFDPLGTQAAVQAPGGAALPQGKGTAPLPFGLDVWAAVRVLSVAWNQTELVVVTFRHGTWELEALALN